MRSRLSLMVCLWPIFALADASVPRKTEGGETPKLRITRSCDLFLDKIYFAQNSAYPVSEKMMESAAAGFAEHIACSTSTTIRKIEVVGHADPREKLAQSLSQRRAETVRDYLAAHGVPKEILLVRAAGTSEPARPGKDRRARSRRVEFTVESIPDA